MTTFQIRQDRLERLLAASVHLRAGKGRGGNGIIDLCFIQATDWLLGGDGKSDCHPCIDAVIRRFGIRLNDSGWASAFRDDLKPYAAKVIGTNQGWELARKRAYMVADWVGREITPLAFDAWAKVAGTGEVKAKAEESASRLRALPPVVDEATAKVAQTVARDAAAVAAAVGAAGVADAAVAAADAAVVAVVAAADAAGDDDDDADDDDVDDAVDAADAAAAAAVAADAAGVAADAAACYAAERRAIWVSALHLLDRLIDATV